MRTLNQLIRKLSALLFKMRQKWSSRIALACPIHSSLLMSPLRHGHSCHLVRICGHNIADLITYDYLLSENKAMLSSTLLLCAMGVKWENVK